MLQSRRFSLDRAGMLGFLDELEVSGGGAMSFYLPPALYIDEIGKLLEKLPGTEADSTGIARLAADSSNGSVLLWGAPRKCLILPPFPIVQKHSSKGYDVQPLRSLLKHDLVIALVLVRLGAYAIGVAQGDRLITSKVGTGLVHARHRQGGSSQKRFERHREKQIESFLNRVCGHVQEQLQPHIRTIDYVVYGGARTTILLLTKQCPLLQRFPDTSLLPPLLTIPEPRQAVLEDALRRVWSNRIIEFI